MQRCAGFLGQAWGKIILLLACCSGGWLNAQGTNESLRIQWGGAGPTSVVLVARDVLWHYRPGTNAPQSDWKTVADEQLTGGWTVGRGGFGFGDPGIAGENTTLNLANVSSTLYIRHTFKVTQPPDPAALVRLVVDYDDGFVAYLDGVEIARGNLTNGVGEAVLHTATTGGRSHEASCCNPPTHPPEVFTVGTAGQLMPVGDHVLAIIGVNQAINSSDMHLIAELRLEPATGIEVHGDFLSIVQTNVLKISGRQQGTATKWVVVNGDDAVGPGVPEDWQASVPLSAGVNRLNVQLLDEAGQVLADTNRLVIVRSNEIAVGGTLPSNTVWSEGSVVRLTNDVVIPPRGSLVIEPAVVVLVGNGVEVRGTNVAVTAQGTEGQPVLWLPADGSNTNWGGISLSGTNTILQWHHGEMLGGYVELRDGAHGVLEDVYLHDYYGSSPPIVQTVGTPNEVTIELRRCHVARYHELLLRLSHVIIEDCLLEYLDYSGDGIDFDGARPGSRIVRTTVRRGNIYNTDALDLGEYSPTEPSRGVLVADCLLHDFVDKGVSMGAYVEVTVSNCVIYNVESGISVKDSSLAAVYQTTVASADYGIRNYNKANTNAQTGGGSITSSWNNIFWDLNIGSVSLLNGSTLEAEYSNFQNTNWPGTGNVSVDPMFVDAARRNYRLATNSPLLAAGRDQKPMGAIYPVGGIPAAPQRLAAVPTVSGSVLLRWLDDADNEDAFEVQRSFDRQVWHTLGTSGADVAEFEDATPARNARIYYRVRAVNSSGNSPWSGVAGALILGAPALGDFRSLPDGGLAFAVEAPRGTQIVLEGSEDLKGWHPLMTTNAPGGLLELSDPEALLPPQRFYRVRLVR